MHPSFNYRLKFDDSLLIHDKFCKKLWYYPDFNQICCDQMKLFTFFLSLFWSLHILAAPRFIPATPLPDAQYEINASALCATAKETLAYLNKGYQYDPQVIHEGKVFRLPLARVKATLLFVCQHQHELQNPSFVKQHFEFYRWYPDMDKAKALSSKVLIANLPDDKILMTKYYVHRAKVSTKPSAAYPYALYALPKDEAHLTLEQANAKPGLVRFRYGKQAILKGALVGKNVPVLAYVNRVDLEAALMQGTLVGDFIENNQPVKTFNVDRNNNIAYDKAKNPLLQERYWYFKAVNGIKGYGKDAKYKITVNPQVTFAADLEQFGLGKLLLVQYAKPDGAMVTRAGIMADTGGAFENNLYQVDFLTGSYAGRDAFYQASRTLPDYVNAYLMIVKK